MRCKHVYYEADKGYMCWLDKKKCPFKQPRESICKRNKNIDK